jgi:hypothetical protein
MTANTLAGLSLFAGRGLGVLVELGAFAQLAVLV